MRGLVSGGLRGPDQNLSPAYFWWVLVGWVRVLALFQAQLFGGQGWVGGGVYFHQLFLTQYDLRSIVIVQKVYLSQQVSLNQLMLITHLTTFVVIQHLLFGWRGFGSSCGLWGRA